MLSRKRRFRHGTERKCLDRVWPSKLSIVQLLPPFSLCNRIPLRAGKNHTVLSLSTSSARMLLLMGKVSRLIFRGCLAGFSICRFAFQWHTRQEGWKRRNRTNEAFIFVDSLFQLLCCFSKYFQSGGSYSLVFCPPCCHVDHFQRPAQDEIVRKSQFDGAYLIEAFHLFGWDMNA